MKSSIIKEDVKKCVKYYINTLVNEYSYTQKKIGKILGVSAPSICSWYSGIKLPSLIHYFALEDIYLTETCLGGVEYEQ